MKIEFRAQAADINEALGVVSIVPPRPITPQGGSGYLFVVKGERCFLYSSDSLHTARAEFPIEPVEGEGSFIYPSENIGLLKLAGDGTITFSVSSEGDVHKVSFKSTSGAKDSRSSYDPRLMSTCDKAVEAATNEKVFPVGVLREALTNAKAFIADGKENRPDDHFKTAQIFDSSKPEWAKGDGVLLAATGVTAFYFQSDAFVGKGLAIHSQHLGLVSTFFGQCQGEVTIRSGTNMTFATDSKGRVLGWTNHEKTHPRFVFYALDLDTVKLDVPVGAMTSAVRYMLSALGKTQDKIRVVYEASEQRIFLRSAASNSETESFPVPVIPQADSAAQDVSFFCNIHHLFNLLSGAKGDRVSLRLAVQEKNEKRSKEVVLARTIDEFLLDKDGKVVPGTSEGKPEGAYQCRVTRFMPSKE